MPEPNFAHDAWSAEAATTSGWGKALEAHPTAEQLTLHLEGRRSSGPADAITPLPESLKQATIDLASHREHWEHEHEALLAELLHLRTLTQEQGDRIFNLEQALDQSLGSQKEMRLQIVDQAFLEQQLSSTEEISNVQQQAITRLKLQLSQQQDTLDTQLLESEHRDQALQDLLATLEVLIQAQQGELEGLRNQLGHDRAAVQSQQGQLEQQVGELRSTLAAQQQQALSTRSLTMSLEIWLDEVALYLRTLLQQPGEHLTACQQLDASLQQIRTALQDQRGETSLLPDPQVPGALRRTAKRAMTPSARLSDTAHWEQELAVAQGKIEELETQIAKQLTTEVMLQHACQELETERDRQQARLTELERQTADMQEQILQQAQQSSEYETAVQHWKDRYSQSHSQLQQIKSLVDQQMLNPPPELMALLDTLQAETTLREFASPVRVTAPLPQTTQIDLPDFLLRRRNKARRS